MTTRQLAAAALASCCVSAFAQDASQNPGTAVQTEMAVSNDLSVFVGLRIWANKWDVPFITREAFLANPVDPNSLLFRDLSTNQVSSVKTTPMPFLAVRYGNILGSISYLPETDYDMGRALSEDVKRDELDVNIGYYVHPRVVLSVGYKEGKQSKITDLVPDSEVQVKGYLLGASFNAPLAGPFNLYGNFAYGIAQSESLDFRTASGESDIDGTYKVGELGISYNLSHLLGSSVLKGAALTFGYRAWVLSFDDIALGIYSPSNPTIPVAIERRDSRSTTDGFVIGAVAVF